MFGFVLFFSPSELNCENRSVSLKGMNKEIIKWSEAEVHTLQDRWSGFISTIIYIATWRTVDNMASRPTTHHTSEQEVGQSVSCTRLTRFTPARKSRVEKCHPRDCCIAEVLQSSGAEVAQRGNAGLSSCQSAPWSGGEKDY